MASSQLYPRHVLETGTFDSADCTYEELVHLMDNFVKMGYHPNADELERVMKQWLADMCLGGDLDEALRLLQSGTHLGRLKQEWIKKQTATYVTPRKRMVPRVVRTKARQMQQDDFKETMLELAGMLNDAAISSREEIRMRDKARLEAARIRQSDEDLEGLLSGSETEDELEAMEMDSDLFGFAARIGCRVDNEGYCFC